MIAAVLPLKTLLRAKSRLAPVLSPTERRTLVQAMATDVMTVVARHPYIDKVFLVSADPWAQVLASDHGAHYLDESRIHGHGLNQILRTTADVLTDNGITSILIMHCDLPLVTADDLSAVIELHISNECAVICRDRHETGSNMLLFDSRYRDRFSFGSDSSKEHQRLFLGAGMKTNLLSRINIGLDIDRSEDLHELLIRIEESGGASTATEALLRSELRSNVQVIRKNRDMECVARIGLELESATTI